MPVHFISGRSLKVRRLLWEQDQAGALPAALSSRCLQFQSSRPIHATRNPGAGKGSAPCCGIPPRRDPLSCRGGLQTLRVKLRLLPGWNTVQVRGNPPAFHLIVAAIRRCGSAATGPRCGINCQAIAPRQCKSVHQLHLKCQGRSAQCEPRKFAAFALLTLFQHPW
jgi:hypothetical protein